MRIPALLLLLLLLAGAGAAPVHAEPEPGPVSAESGAALTAPAPAGMGSPSETGPVEDPYQKRMSAGHRVQPPRPRASLTPHAVGLLKAMTALAGASVLLWNAFAARERESRGQRRWRTGALLGLGAAAAFGGSNFGAFHHPVFGHDSDSYRQFIGSKYFAELGSTRLYLCAGVADAEAGLRDQVERRYPRDPAAGDPDAAATALAQPDICKAHFTPERWAAFQADIAWFRDRGPVRRWQEIQAEPGYTATPVWTALAGSLAKRIPATDAGIFALQLLDPLLLAGMWAGVTLVFGWRVACVGLLFWGTNHPAGFDATGGSFLRSAWLVASVLALCALRRERPATAGALLGLASALDGFPIFVLAAFGVQALAEMFTARRLSLAPAQRRLFVGALVAGGLLFAASLAAGGGFEAWSAWFANRQARLATPLGDGLGLASVVSSTWIALVLLLGYLALLASASRRAQAWEVGVFGLGCVLIAGHVPGYASAGLLAFALLWPRQPMIGVALCLLSFAGWWIAGSGPRPPRLSRASAS